MKKRLLAVSVLTSISNAVGYRTEPRVSIIPFKYIYSSLFDFNDHVLSNKLFIANLNLDKQFKRKHKVKPIQGYRQYKSKGCNLQR